MSKDVRIAGLGYSLTDDRWSETFDFDDEESLLGYDVIVWDVAASLGDDATTSVEQVTRRTEEIAHHLGGDKPLVVMLPPPTRLTDEDGYDIPFSSDDLLPVPEIQTVAAKGDRFELSAGEPFKAFWEIVDDLATYNSYLATPVGEPLLRIRHTTHVVAALCRLDQGQILLLPRISSNFTYLDDDDRARKDEDGNDIAHVEVTDSLLELLHRQEPSEEPPGWTDRYVLKGEAELRVAKTKARAAIERAAEMDQRATTGLAALHQRKHLLSGTGTLLEKAVMAALRGIGFSVESGPEGRTDCIARAGRRTAVIEIKGKTKSASERDAAQLQKWVADYHASNGRSPKGVLIVNPWRTRLLDKREEAFPDQMLGYSADQQGHCLLTSTQLLYLWLEADAYPSRKPKIISSILRTVGRYSERPGWGDLLEAKPEQDDADQA